MWKGVCSTRFWHTLQLMQNKHQRYVSRTWLRTTSASHSSQKKLHRLNTHRGIIGNFYRIHLICIWEKLMNVGNHNTVSNTHWDLEDFSWTACHLNRYLMLFLPFPSNSNWQQYIQRYLPPSWFLFLCMLSHLNISEHQTNLYARQR